MRISVTAPVELALNHTKAILFDDFRFKMWLGLGFCAFLGTLLSGGVNFNFNMDFSQRPPFGTPAGTDVDGTQIPFLGFLERNPVLSTVLGILIVAVLVVMLWIQSRGRFMFLDGVLTNSGAVVEPWKTFRYLGNSVFRLQLGLGIISGVIGLPFGLLFAYRLLNLPNLRLNEWPFDILLVGLGILLVLFSLFHFVVLLLLNDFFVPTMYRRNLLVSDAWGVVRAEILPGRILKILLFYLMKLLLGIAIGILVLIGVCVTCCVAGLPYVSSVVFLPFLVFMRLYSIYFLEQFGPDWWFFARDEAADPGPAPPEPVEGGPEPPAMPTA